MLAIALLLALLAAPGGAGARAAVESPVTTVRIPMTEKRLLGGARELRLEATLYRADGAGAAPLVIFNHGSTGAGRGSPAETLTYQETARFFVERGWAVLIPMRRGRGASEGEYLERYECDRSVLSAGVDRAIEDLDAVMAFVARQAWVDPSRLLLAGMSRGGFLSIVYASQRKTNARGVINFAGGWTADACDQRIHFHAQTLAWAGRTSLLPELWLYSENDRNYGPGAVRSFHQAFTGAGGKADLRLFPPIGHDGHILLPRSVSVWRDAVDGFLRQIGLG